MKKFVCRVEKILRVCYGCSGVQNKIDSNFSNEFFLEGSISQMMMRIFLPHIHELFMMFLSCS